MPHDSFGWVGSVLEGKVRIDSVLGEGGFGIVYRGHHIAFDAPVAVKFLKIPGSIDEEARRHFEDKFLSEGKLLHKLSSITSHVVRPMDMGFTEAPGGAWTPYITMEFLDGDSLEKVIDARVSSGAGPFTIAEAIELLDGAARAIGAAHKLNITHRDIKPANIHSTSVAGRRVFKILDFGIAKVMTENVGLTRALQATGNDIRSFTARYGAPEQFSRKLGATGPWTDVYAMALLFIEMVTGRPALDGDDIQQLYVASTDKESRPSLRAAGLAAPDAVEQVLQVALRVEPRERYLSANEFWEAMIAASESCSNARLAQQTAVTMTAPMTVDAGDGPIPDAGQSVQSRQHAISYAKTLPASVSAEGSAATTAPATSTTAAPSQSAGRYSSGFKRVTILGAALALGLGIAASLAVAGYTRFASGPATAVTKHPANAWPKPAELLKPSDIKASSSISNAREQHPPRDAFDGEKKTAWNESAKGPGAGEWIEASWSVPRRIRRVVFSTGFDHVSPTEGDLFPRNAHAKAVRLVFSDGTTITRRVSAEQREVDVTELNVVSVSLRLIADDVWPGSSWQDWCVSEIQIWADPAD